MKTVKTVNANPDQPLSAAEREAWEQFQASDRPGQALFHPWVDPQDAAPDCVVFVERIGRLVVRFMPGRFLLQDRPRLREDATGGTDPVPDPLKEIWRSANAVRDKLKSRPDIGVYAIPVLVFPDIEPDAGILAQAQKRKVRVLFGRSDLVSNLVDLPSEAEVRPEFSSRYIEEEVQLLMHRHDEVTDRSETPVEAPADEATSNEATAEAASPAVEGPAGVIMVQRVEVMHLNVTIVYGGTGAEPPLLTVQGG